MKCVRSIWALPEREGGGGGVGEGLPGWFGALFFPTFAQGCKDLSGWFGALFSTFACLTKGVGLKLFKQYPYRTNTFQKGASLISTYYYGFSTDHRPRPCRQ